MPFIKRDEQGSICAVSEVSGDGFDEQVAEDSAELTAFLAQWQSDNNDLAGSDLNGTDLGFIRVLEDVIEVLISKNVIRFTDLPEAARTKMQQRQRLREGITNRLDLLDDQDDF